MYSLVPTQLWRQKSFVIDLSMLPVKVYLCALLVSIVAVSIEIGRRMVRIMFVFVIWGAVLASSNVSVVGMAFFEVY